MKKDLALLWGLTLTIFSTIVCAEPAVSTTTAPAADVTDAATATATTKTTADASSDSNSALTAEEILNDPAIKETPALQELVAQCQKDDQISCLTMAMFYERQQKVSYGNYWLERACNLGSAISCVKLGSNLVKAYKNTQQTSDGELALVFYGKAAYQTGNFGLKDEAKAVQFFVRASELHDAMGALSAGRCYQEGIGVTVDNKQALEHFSRACDLQNGYGCYKAAHLYAIGAGVEKSVDQSSAFLEKGCNLDDASSCLFLGQQYLHGLGKEQSTAQAKALFAKACELKSEKACAYAAALKDKN